MEIFIKDFNIGNLEFVSLEPSYEVENQNSDALKEIFCFS